MSDEVQTARSYRSSVVDDNAIISINIINVRFLLHLE